MSEPPTPEEMRSLLYFLPNNVMDTDEAVKEVFDSLACKFCGKVFHKRSVAHAHSLISLFTFLFPLSFSQEQQGEARTQEPHGRDPGGGQGQGGRDRHRDRRKEGNVGFTVGPDHPLNESDVNPASFSFQDGKKEGRDETKARHDSGVVMGEGGKPVAAAEK